MHIIGERLQKCRLEKNITQQKMARDLDISFHYLSKIEHGQANFTLDLLVKICEYLDVDLAYAISGSIYRNEIYGRNLPMRLIEAFTKASPKKQEIIYQILSTLEDI